MADSSLISRFDAVGTGKTLAAAIAVFFIILLAEGLWFQSRDEGQCGTFGRGQSRYETNSAVELGVGDSFCVKTVAQKSDEDLWKEYSQRKAPPPKTGTAAISATTPVFTTAPATPVKPPAPASTAASSASPSAAQLTQMRQWRCFDRDSGKTILAHCSGWQLFIDGKPTATSETLDKSTLRFILPRTFDAAHSNSALIREIWGGRASGWNPVAETAIRLCATDDLPAGRSPYCILLPHAKLRIYHVPMLITGGLLLMAFAGGLVWMCRNTGIIRDPGNGTYSLARTQVMYWFALVTAGFVFIYMSTGQYIGVVTTETLALLGIYSATGWFAAARSAPAVDPATRASTIAAHTEGSFLAELLTDGTTDDKAGFGLHRLITIIWSIILGAIMVQWVVGEKVFANFDSSQLALAGLTSGLFAVMKPDANKPAK